jgi:uncharacterized iron-regulated membrane protein
MLRWHRHTAFFSFILIFYVVATGLAIEASDLRAITVHAPPTDPDMLMMNQHIFGTPNYAVVSAPDYVAPALPPSFDWVGGIRRAAVLGRAAAPGADLQLVEVRGVAGRPAGRVRMSGKALIFDLATGKPLPDSALPPPEPGRNFSAPRANFKFFHRFNYIGQLATGLDGLAGAALAGLVITGLIQYARLLAARRRTGRGALLWKGGGTWRQLHRWIALGAALPVLWLATTGFILSVDNMVPGIAGLARDPLQKPAGPDAFDGFFGAPLRDAQLDGMTSVTLAAYRAQAGSAGIKVLQLRYFAGYAQGVVIAGDAATTQHVYNTATGAPMSMTEPGYPKVSFPLGWEWHQKMKQLHRGDFFGMTGRWLDFAGACGALYLLVSGAVMYLDQRRRRLKSGRTDWVWK